MLTALSALMLAVTLGRLWKKLAAVFGSHPITPLMAKARKVGWAWIVALIVGIMLIIASY